MRTKKCQKIKSTKNFVHVLRLKFSKTYKKLPKTLPKFCSRFTTKFVKKLQNLLKKKPKEPKEEKEPETEPIPLTPKTGPRKFPASAPPKMRDSPGKRFLQQLKEGGLMSSYKGISDFVGPRAHLSKV